MKTLPLQPRYFPLEKGRYTTTPDLKALGTDFGNGYLDQVAFQFDEHTPRFLANKTGRPCAPRWRACPRKRGPTRA